MSVRDIEDRVRELAPDDLVRFAQWFDEYCASQAATVEPEISLAQKEELLKRRAEYLAAPSIAEPWDEASYDRFIKGLSDARAKGASRSKV